MGKLKNTPHVEEDTSSIEPGHDTQPEPTTPIDDGSTTEQNHVATVPDEPKTAPHTNLGPVIKYRLSQFRKRLFRSKKLALAVAGVICVVVAAVAAVEPLRFGVLNVFSKGSAEFVVVDDTTLVPLDGARVSVGMQTATTNKEGKVTLHKVAYGTQGYDVENEAYTVIHASIKVKPGLNFVGPIKLHSDGIPLRITATNKLSNDTLKHFTVALNGSKTTAQSNDEGTAVLKVPSDKLGEVTIEVSGDGFNTYSQKTTVTRSSAQPIRAQLVPAGKQYFLSNRTGKVSVFSANLDGSEQTEVIRSEVSDDGTTLSVAPDNKHAAMVSKRDNVKGADGSLMPALFAIDLEQKTIKRIDEGAPNFALISWPTNNQVAYNVSYNDYQRSDNSKTKLADVTTGTLSTIFTAKGYTPYFAFPEDPSHIYISASDQSVEQYGLYSVDATTKKSSRLLDYPTYNASQYKPHSFVTQSDSKWYSVDMKLQKATETPRPTETAILPTPSPDGQQTVWTEQRDGKGVVVIASGDGSNPRTISKTTDASSIVRWQGNDYVIYYTYANNVWSLYIAHIPSGAVTKISDVYNQSYRQY